MYSSSSTILSNPLRNLRRRSSAARSKRALRSPLCEQTPTQVHCSPRPNLAKLRVAVLDHLNDLESRLSQLESPLREMGDQQRSGTSNQFLQVPTPRSTSVSAIDDARVRISDGLDMLSRIRADVCSHLPDLPGFDFDFLPDFSDVRSHIPSFEFPELDLHMPSTSFKPSLDDVSFNLDKFQSRLSYLPTLTNHLDSLHEHVLSLQLPSSLSLNFAITSSNGIISDLLYKLQDPDFLTDPLKTPLDFLGDSRETSEIAQAQTTEGQAALWKSQIEHALIKSHNGDRLILFEDLPFRYHNDEFVRSRYRLIPLFRWPLLLCSVFQFHNETANIWTHLLPLVLSLGSLSSFTPLLPYSQWNHTFPVDIAERVFGLFANFCLFTSCIWHIMSGCAHMKTMETAARVDYVGIGWLISASIGSVVFYGFGCRPQTAAIYLSTSFALGVAGSILPFMDWFNERQNKKWRIMFFLSLIFTLIIPLAHLAAIHSLSDMYIFIQPEFPSLTAYAVGLAFYAFHFPECVIPTGWTQYTDWFGGGSHAIWHLFIVLAIKLHKDAMVEYRGGIGDEVCTLAGWGVTSTPT